MQFKSQKLLLNGRCCAQTLKNHNFHPHLSIGGGKNRMKGGFAKALGKSVDRSQPLFYFVPQDSHSQVARLEKCQLLLWGFCPKSRNISNAKVYNLDHCNAMAYHAIKVTMHIHIEASLEKYAEGSGKKKLPHLKSCWRSILFFLACIELYKSNFNSTIIS